MKTDKQLFLEGMAKLYATPIPPKKAKPLTASLAEIICSGTNTGKKGEGK